MIGDIKVINTHAHIFPDKIAIRAVKGTDDFYGTASVFDGTVKTLLNEMDSCGVDKTIVCSVATTEKQVSSINSFINDEVIKSDGRLVGLGAVYPGSENSDDEILQSVKFGFKGIKIHPDIQHFKVDDERCLKIYSLCEKYGLKVLLHTGDYRYDNSNPDRMADVLKAFKDVTFIGAHFGGWSVQDEASDKLSGFDNFFVDTSSSFAYMTEETVKKVFSKYGTEKIMFATDYPMWSVSQEILNFAKINLNYEEKCRIFYKNAIKVFGL